MISTGLLLTIVGGIGIVVCIIALIVNHRSYKKRIKNLLEEIENE